jgi:hypothetical protein
MNTNELIAEDKINSEINTDNQNKIKNGHNLINKVSGSSLSSNLGKITNMTNLNPNQINQNYLNVPEEILNEKSKKWRQFNTKRFSEKRKFGFVEGQKESLPCEVLRYLIIKIKISLKLIFRLTFAI